MQQAQAERDVEQGGQQQPVRAAAATVARQQRRRGQGGQARSDQGVAGQMVAFPGLPEGAHLGHLIDVGADQRGRVAKRAMQAGWMEQPIGPGRGGAGGDRQDQADLSGGGKGGASQTQAADGHGGDQVQSDGVADRDAPQGRRGLQQEGRRQARRERQAVGARRRRGAFAAG